MTEEVKAVKKVTEVTEVIMTDGRVVAFPGKRKVQKETLIDTEKMLMSNSEGEYGLCLDSGCVSIRMDFRNGETRTIPLPLELLL